MSPTQIWSARCLPDCCVEAKPARAVVQSWSAGWIPQVWAAHSIGLQSDPYGAVSSGPRSSPQLQKFGRRQVVAALLAVVLQASNPTPLSKFPDLWETPQTRSRGPSGQRLNTTVLDPGAVALPLVWGGSISGIPAGHLLLTLP